MLLIFIGEIATRQWLEDILNLKQKSREFIRW